jgi:hypothetical protein
MPALPPKRGLKLSLSYETGRLVILSLGLAATLFFLIFARYDYPGGAFQFIDWANLLVSGGRAAPDLAQRDIGYPLLLVLSGYPFTHSFIGITLINAAFALLIPLLVHGTIGPKWPALAFVGGLATILSASPYLLMKLIHHDHAYVFFTLLTLYFGVRFLRREQYRNLYFMTLAAIAASLTRPAGNLFFLVAIGFVAAALPRRWRHYAACIVLFAAAIGGYALYRHTVGLDDPKDSYTGRQIFYNPYINSREYGIRIGPELGPATTRLIASVRAGLTAHPIDSQFFQDWLAGQHFPKEAADRYFQGRTVDELVDRVLTHPQYDFFELLCLFEPDDRVFRDAAIEIVAHHPFYAVAYTARNLVLFFGTDGFGHSRFGLEDQGLVRTGIYFSPLIGTVVDDGRILNPGADELRRDPLAGAKWLIRLYQIWQAKLRQLIGATFILAIVGVAGVWFAGRDARLTCWFSGLVALYNGAVVSAIVEPVSRYHFPVMPEQIICAAFGVLVLGRFVASWWRRADGATQVPRNPTLPNTSKPSL